MLRRRFASESKVQSSRPLAALLAQHPGRLPFELAFDLAVEVVSAVADAHHRGQRFGRLDARHLAVEADGSVVVTAPPVPGADLPTDVHAVGAVLYQLFTGLTPRQAQARRRVPSVHGVPAASEVHPGLDDSVDTLVMQLLAGDPAARPASLRTVEGWLAGLCDELGCEPSRARVLRLAALVPALQAVPPPPAMEEAAAEAGDDEEAPRDAPGPLRFDGWAVAACAFSVAAFAIVTAL